MTAVLDAPADLTGLTDDELTAMYATADDATIAALTAECDRRDREARIAAGREAGRKYEAHRLEWYENCAYPEFQRAQAYCGGGKMLSLLGERNTDEPSVLWTGSEEDAQAWASEELKAWWLDHPRTTFRTWLRQRARGLRAQREDAMDESRIVRGETGPATGATSPQRSKYTGHMPAMQAKRREAGGRMDTEQAAPEVDRFEDADAWRAKSQARRAAIAKTAAEAGIRPATGTVAVRQAPASPALVSAPIDGNRLLTQSYGYLGHMAVWPSQAAQITATLYPAAASAVDEKTRLPVWTYMPRMFYTSKEGGSGKSWMSRLTASLCPDPERLAEMTKASLIDLIAEHHTVVITELDVFVGTGKRNQWLTGIANVGYEFDGKTSRKQGGKVLKISLCGPMILDGLDSVIHSTGVDLKTLMSRCIIVHVERAPEGYRPPRYDREKQAIAGVISGRFQRWMAQEVKDGIGDAAPDVPQHLGNRPFNLWEPMFAVAEAAGGPWPEMAAYACEHIETSTGLPGDDEADEARVNAALDGWGAASVDLGNWGALA